MRREYFTHWSTHLLIAAILLRNEVLLAAAIANTLVVSVAGPCVLAYGNVPGDARSLHRANFFEHALPVVVAWFLRTRASRVSRWHVVAALLLFDVFWLALPLQEGGAMGFAKIRVLYGVGYEWLMGMAALQLAAIVLML